MMMRNDAVVCNIGHFDCDIQVDKFTLSNDMSTILLAEEPPLLEDQAAVVPPLLEDQAAVEPPLLEDPPAGGSPYWRTRWLWSPPSCWRTRRPWCPPAERPGGCGAPLLYLTRPAVLLYLLGPAAVSCFRGQRHFSLLLFVLERPLGLSSPASSDSRSLHLNGGSNFPQVYCSVLAGVVILPGLATRLSKTL